MEFLKSRNDRKVEYEKIKKNKMFKEYEILIF